MPEPAYYPDTEVTRLELLWGEGFLSPGGAEEVGLLLGEQALAGCHVLDVGSGTGGPDLLLIRDHGAARVTGIDVQAELVDVSRTRAGEAGLADRVDYRLVEPGPFPFPDQSFDAVFSKDAIVHVDDKAAMYGELFRVLRPGGRLFVSDWLRGAGQDSDGLVGDPAFQGFALVTLAELAEIAAAVGFVDVETEDRNAWYAPLAAQELERFRGELGTQVRDQLGEEELEGSLQFWEVLASAVASAVLSPGHLRARRPG